MCTSGRLTVRRQREGSLEPERGLSLYDPGEVIAGLSFKFLSRSDGNLQSAACHLKTVGAGEKSNRMKFGPDKVTVIEGDALLRQHLASILADAGFQVFAEPAATTKTIVESMPDVIVMTGNPLQFDCVTYWQT
jgi:hypothetical protein